MIWATHLSTRGRCHTRRGITTSEASLNERRPSDRLRPQLMVLGRRVGGGCSQRIERSHDDAQHPLPTFATHSTRSPVTRTFRISSA
jgi:hypothetical protein